MMQWIILLIILAILYYFIILKPGRLDFWKLAIINPDRVFDCFQQRDCWKVFVDTTENRCKNALPPGEWDGPFKLAIPKFGGKVITIFGKIQEYEQAQRQFLQSIKETS